MSLFAYCSCHITCGQGSFPLSLVVVVFFFFLHAIKWPFLLVYLAHVGSDSVSFLISGYLTFVNLMTVLAIVDLTVIELILGIPTGLWFSWAPLASVFEQQSLWVLVYRLDF